MYKRAGFVFFSGALLVFAFPKWDCAFLAWPALAFLLLSLKGQSDSRGFFLGFFCGIVFFPGLFYWITGVAGYRIGHHLLLALYLCAYFGLFGMGLAFLERRLGWPAALWAAPFLWVALEYLRSNLSFLALPWGLIGQTPYRYPVMIQGAALVGTYGLSFLIVLQSAGLAAAIQAIRQRENRPPNSIHEWTKGSLGVTAAAGVSLILALSFGLWRLGIPVQGETLEIALVQANIAQSRKWDPRYAETILETYRGLTLRAAAMKPELIVWPETATPGAVTSDRRIFNAVFEMAQKTGVPLLLGSAQYQKWIPPGKSTVQLTNSAFLLHPEQSPVLNQRYDKVRLFPFGEYLPYKNVLPWHWIRVSSLSEYAPGTEYTVLELPPHRLGVTLCWENIFPELVRRFVKNGAQVIINLTNEARFGDTAASYQFMAASVFRAVENGVFVIRCANTGISCIIDSRGRILQKLKDHRGRHLFIRGLLKGTALLTNAHTVYTKIGDWVPAFSIAGVLCFMIAGLFDGKASRMSHILKQGQRKRS